MSTLGNIPHSKIAIHIGDGTNGGDVFYINRSADEALCAVGD